MSPDIRFACTLFRADGISIWILRDTLNDFMIRDENTSG